MAEAFARGRLPPHEAKARRSMVRFGGLDVMASDVGQLQSEEATFAVELSGDYERLAEVGRGASSVVYLARALATGRQVALKVFRGSAQVAASTHRLVKRFEREAQVMARLANPHIVELIETGIYDGKPCMVLAYIDGVGLDELLREDGKLSIDFTFEIFDQILDALEASHAVGVVHRDLKPSNIMLQGQAGGCRVCVLDFGIAALCSSDDLAVFEAGAQERLTRQGEWHGTPSYMAPELFGRGEVGPATDLYALGLILYECLTGKVAFGGSQLFALAYDQVHKPLSLGSDVPASFRGVIRKASEKEVGARYGDAAQMRLALREAHADYLRSSAADGVGFGHLKWGLFFVLLLVITIVFWLLFGNVSDARLTTGRVLGDLAAEFEVEAEGREFEINRYHIELNIDFAVSVLHLLDRGQVMFGLVGELVWDAVLVDETHSMSVIERGVGEKRSRSVAKRGAVVGKGKASSTSQIQKGKKSDGVTLPKDLVF